MSAPGAHPFDRPLSSRLDEQDAFVIFDDVEDTEVVVVGGGVAGPPPPSTWPGLAGA